MKLQKALKEKNKRGGELKQLLSRLQDSNTFTSISPSSYDFNEVEKEYLLKKSELVALKVAIQKATVPILDKIIEQAELKSLAMGLLNTTTNSTKSSDELNRDGVVVYQHLCALTTKEMDLKIVSIKEQIEKLQDEIDHFNATTDVIM